MDTMEKVDEESVVRTKAFPTVPVDKETTLPSSAGAPSEDVKSATRNQDDDCTKINLLPAATSISSFGHLNTPLKADAKEERSVVFQENSLRERANASGIIGSGEVMKENLVGQIRLDAVNPHQDITAEEKRHSGNTSTGEHLTDFNPGCTTSTDKTFSGRTFSPDFKRLPDQTHTESANVDREVESHSPIHSGIIDYNKASIAVSAVDSADKCHQVQDSSCEKKSAVPSILQNSSVVSDHSVSPSNTNVGAPEVCAVMETTRPCIENVCHMNSKEQTSHYSLSSEAERQEEILAMHRNIPGDTQVRDRSVQQVESSEANRAIIRPGVNVTPPPPNKDRLATTEVLRASPIKVRVKEEPLDPVDTTMESSDGPVSQARQDTSILTTNTKGQVNVPAESLNKSNDNENVSVCLPAGSMPITEDQVDVLKQNSTGRVQAPAALPHSQTLQPEEITAEVLQLECIVDSGLPTYKPPDIPVEFRDKLTNVQFTCESCGDTFLFKSSLDMHMNRQSLQIICKHSQCENQSPPAMFTNRCLYLIHLKQHGKTFMDGNPKFTVSAASNQMIDDLKDTFKLPGYEAARAELLSKLNVQWKCMECDTLLETAKQLSWHFVPQHTEGLEGQQCEKCKKHFYTNCSLTAHMRTHVRTRPYVCPECGQHFLGSWEAFAKHMGVKCFHMFRQPSLKCPKSGCDFELSDFQKMTVHLMSHSEEYLKCQKCPMAFKGIKGIQNHMKNVHQEDHVTCAHVFKCAICDTVFHNKTQMTFHTSGHVGDHNKKPKYFFKCWFCPYLFEKKSQLEGHLISVHRVKQSKIICDLCGQDFESVDKLCNHLEDHKPISTSADSACPTLISEANTALRVQEQLPSRKDKPAKKLKIKVDLKPGSLFLCSGCDFQCMKSSTAEVHAHIRKHRLDGIYLCPICFTAKFETLTDLHRHQFLCRKKRALQKGAQIKAKKGEAMSCQKCPAKFSNEEEMATHMQAEHGIAPQFPCHLCGLTYDTRQNLHQHLQVIHEGKKHLYLCWICQSKNLKRTFTIASKLERHLVSKHRVPRNIIDPEKFPRLLPGLNDKDMVVDGNSKRGVDVEAKQAPIKRLKLADDTIFTCAKCQFSTEDQKVFELHIKDHKTESSKQCPECGLCFSVLPSLKKHLIMVHKIKDINSYVESREIKEPKALKACAEQYDIAESSLGAESGNPLECRVCHRNFEDEATVKTHMRTHGMAFIRSKRSLNQPGTSSESS